MNYGKFSAVFLLLGAVAVGGYAMLAQAGVIPRHAAGTGDISPAHDDADHGAKEED